MKYVLQNINAYTGEVLGEMVSSDLENTFKIIKHYEDVEKNRDKSQSIIVLLDSDKELWDAEYLTYTIDESEKDQGKIIYKALFKVKKREKQIDFDRTIL